MNFLDHWLVGVSLHEQLQGAVLIHQLLYVANGMIMTRAQRLMRRGNQ